MTFFGGFLHVPLPLPCPFVDTLILWEMQGVWVVHIPSFQCSNVFQPAENITQSSYIKAASTPLLHLVNTKLKLLRVLLKKSRPS